jgi:phosphate transport system substrate-binding protein
MKSIIVNAFLLLSLISIHSHAQSSASAEGQKQKVVIITGVRFAYPLVQKWIDDYNTINPSVQLVIEARGSADPSSDILIEAYEPADELRRNREYVYIARYAVLPVANATSQFARVYSDKGLNEELIKQLFFHNLFADKDKEQTVKAPYTAYTRLQKAGAPVVFARYFGFEQKDIHGKAIAGSDEHLLKAILRDSTAISYLPLTLVYDHASKKPVNGISVLPVDFNGNGRISDEEKFFGDLSTVIQKLEAAGAKDIHNVPVEYIHLSVDKQKASAEAIEFIQWVIQHGQEDLHAFGYLNPEPARSEKETFEQFASRRIKQ